MPPRRNRARSRGAYMKQDYLTEEDLGNALKQPWSPTTCLVAQCMIRNGALITDNNDPGNVILDHNMNGPALDAMVQFDKSYRYLTAEWQTVISELRKQLPIPITLP